MIKLKNFTPRSYQKEILDTCLTHNTLVVLPTGIGKTFISLLLAYERLKKFPDSKILITAPTKPLCSQHVQTFKQHTNLTEEIVLFTGTTTPEKRAQLFKDAKIIIATPQTIQSDLNSKRITLDNLSMICMDEAHRSRENYANTIIAKSYTNASPFPRILALTASPGSSKERIDEICENLFIERVEIRTEDDAQVKPHVKEKKIEWVDLNLTKDFKEISTLVRSHYNRLLSKLHSFGVTKPLKLINRRDLLELQKKFSTMIRQRNKRGYFGASLTASLIKLDHAVTLLETQSINSFIKYCNKLKKETTKAAKSIVKDKNFEKAYARAIANEELKHPKLEELIKIAKKAVSKNKNTRIIIFANFRYMVDEILKVLKDVEHITPTKLIGQKEGMSQKQQVNIIKQFEDGTFNVLIGTSITEEGLNLRGSDLAIFYDTTASEIRNIQRKGRVGRFEAGKIIMLVTKNTRDEAFKWVSHHKEKKMQKILTKMKHKQETQSKLK